MDLNPSENGEENKKLETSQNNPEQEPKPEIKREEQKPAIQSPMMKMLGGQKFYMPKLKMPNFKEKFAEYGRVWKVTKKPDSEEFKAIVKASGLGIIVIGMVGFIIAIIVQLIQMI